MHNIMISAEALKAASNWAMEGENVAPVELLLENDVLTVTQGDDTLRLTAEGRTLTPSPVSEALAIRAALADDPFVSNLDFGRLVEEAADADERRSWDAEKGEQGEDDEELLAQAYGGDHSEPCVHGHLECSTVEGGACANETYARLLVEKYQGEA